MCVRYDTSSSDDASMGTELAQNRATCEQMRRGRGREGERNIHWLNTVPRWAGGQEETRQARPIHIMIVRRWKLRRSRAAVLFGHKKKMLQDN